MWKLLKDKYVKRYLLKLSQYKEDYLKTLEGHIRKKYEEDKTKIISYGQDENWRII